ncbi:unnamed protein product [Enterobius vermicularis]|uniref:Guanine nucleotide-binding protein G(Q) subunit alpha n=1 Tax=Enterobius vermicularis TaxID=51028 RepID=A0A0N4VF08_ENTVE|nr:unnamed protein product [Enterobius vermicularis]
MGLECCKPNYPIEDESDEKEVVRFFMVGMGGAGKSTVIRQLMKLCIDCPNSYKLYDSEWVEKTSIHSEGDLRKWKIVIQHNILEAFCNTIKQSKLFGFEFNGLQSLVVSEVEKLCGDVRTLHLRTAEWSPFFNEELGRKLITLISNEKDPIKCALKRCHEFAAEYRLPDGVDHFITPQKIMEYARADTLPDEDDIVHARNPTSGLDYYHFLVHKMRIQIHDMGGQMVERKKVLEYLSHWISDSKPNHRNFILYVVSIADYNVIHPSRRQYTLLDESIAFMKMILNLSQVQECGFLIFFNKSDIFDEKVSDEHFRPDFRTFLKEFIKEDELKKYERGAPVKSEVFRKAIANKFAKEISNNAVKRKAPVYHRYVYLCC